MWQSFSRSERGSIVLEKRSKNAAYSETLLLFPALRRLVYDAFDARNMHFTRTQQMILSVMSNGETFSMTELAKLIDTSNEQATRAVSQLVKRGLIVRAQNEVNHRVVNIRLTDEAKEVTGQIIETIGKRLLTAGAFEDKDKEKEKNARICECIREMYKLLEEKEI